MDNRFCIIGDKRTTSIPVTRTFLPTRGEADLHAEKLIRTQLQYKRRYYDNPSGLVLFITEIVGVVTVDTIPGQGTVDFRFLHPMSFVHPTLT
jgi:hypothetical protein